MPGLEAAPAGLAVAAYSADDAVVMGVSAARLHGVIPRALATAVVAVPTRHDPIRLADRHAVVRFVVRDTARLDAERIDTKLGAVLVTTAEQTVLDLMKRPRLGEPRVRCGRRWSSCTDGAIQKCWPRSPMLRRCERHWCGCAIGWGRSGEPRRAGLGGNVIRCRACAGR
jgi:hypothetical protein